MQYFMRRSLVHSNPGAIMEIRIALFACRMNAMFVFMCVCVRESTYRMCVSYLARRLLWKIWLNINLHSLSVHRHTHRECECACMHVSAICTENFQLWLLNKLKRTSQMSFKFCRMRRGGGVHCCVRILCDLIRFYVCISFEFNCKSETYCI